mmetsp:Transcript_119582/g.349721  ORF Transcript_119582/g.349721 Transcript_119582/m.349721 type:complete len:208 (-) Transcript_119582:342-965(-)
MISLTSLYKVPCKTLNMTPQKKDSLIVRALRGDGSLGQTARRSQALGAGARRRTTKSIIGGLGDVGKDGLRVSGRRAGARRSHRTRHRGGKEAHLIEVQVVVVQCVPDRRSAKNRWVRSAGLRLLGYPHHPLPGQLALRGGQRAPRITTACMPRISPTPAARGASPAHTSARLAVVGVIGRAWVVVGTITTCSARCRGSRRCGWRGT